jgi:uncharacterized protein YecT (DUF1311 family)
MTNRDRTQQILDVKQRDARWTRFGPHGLQLLRQQWLKNRQSEACTPDFYVVRAVTLLEVFTRRNLADLIDHNRQFTDRAIELSKHVKIDFALVRDIQGRTITLGDILAHSVPVNSMGQILGCFETVLGKSLRPLLETIVDRWDVEIMKKPSAPIVDDYDEMARCLARLFEVRHILCHEAPRKAVYEIKEIDEFLQRAIRFTKALHEALTFERFGRVPLSQADMNIAAGRDLEAAEERMNHLLSEVETRVRDTDRRLSEVNLPKQDGSTWLGRLIEVRDKWVAYRNAQCEFHTYLNRGGTIRPLVWATEANRLTQLRIADLDSWLKRDSES